jgi:DNA-binding MarR family transcriptional regulator
MVELTEIKKALRAPRELASRPSFLLKRLGMISKEKTVDAFEDAGAVPYDYAVLAVLAQGACATQAHIADSLNYDRSYLVGLLDELERRGLIERRRDLNDRRRHVVTLTKAGAQELVRLRELVEGVESDLFAPLTAAERKTLQGLLAKLAAAHDPRYATD